MKKLPREEAITDAMFHDAALMVMISSSSLTLFLAETWRQDEEADCLEEESVECLEDEQSVEYEGSRHCSILESRMRIKGSLLLYSPLHPLGT